ncbi:hypothetical protein JJV70_20540 [Streptomyces sp. JJ66]|uniref:hypothetical protein n=1 Tax=Streptomyces sp. JJ66 TaxID=2803843 RepID=UPI001C59776F|nr:hypothetical protein [Streptomyces sp. JJ66]MBW1604448.1 hypothetical protein [Streptomyces sp. JJ66]
METEEEPETRPQVEINNEIKSVSSRILDIVALEGKVSEPGPGVGECPGKDLDTYFIMRHTWSLASEDRKSLAASMEKLKHELPESGWEIKEYGPKNNQNRTLRLLADHPEKKYGINVEFWEQRKSDGKPMLLVGVVSACYQVPPGDTVEHY